jgi:hypothetical protein
MIPIMMAYWFAPILIIFKKMTIKRAFQWSYKACINNMLPFTIYSLLLLFYAFLGFIFLSLLVSSIPLLAIPFFYIYFILLFSVLFASIYTSYNAIFEKSRTPPLDDINMLA